jgi:17beta-estradiol 17-dehydrogenase / very-long-chain 3-oxoacyl-CoA reductase
MTRMVLPGMVARRKGLIINMSSTGASGTTPLIAVYSATKVRCSDTSQNTVAKWLKSLAYVILLLYGCTRQFEGAVSIPGQSEQMCSL